MKTLHYFQSAAASEGWNEMFHAIRPDRSSCRHIINAEAGGWFHMEPEGLGCPGSTDQAAREGGIMSL